jgi:hypothetical protein
MRIDELGFPLSESPLELEHRTQWPACGGEYPPFLLVVNLSPVVSLHWARRVLTYFPVTAIVAPGGWATAKRPFSDFVAVRTLPRNRNPSLPRLL